MINVGPGGTDLHEVRVTGLSDDRVGRLQTKPEWAPDWAPSVEDDRSLRWLWGLLWLVLALGFTACMTRGGDEPADPTVLPPTATTPDGAPAFPDGFATVTVDIQAADEDEDDGDGYCLLLADTPERQQRGLMQVTDPELAGFDGMLFRFDTADAGIGFWMRNTPMPLSIAYFGPDGHVVSTADMAPCEDRADCPSYPAGGPVQWALEVPQGQLEDLGIDAGAVLTDTKRPCAPDS